MTISITLQKVYETLINIWLFSNHAFHSQCYCCNYLLQIIHETGENWNNNDWINFSIVLNKILTRDSNYREVFEKVIKSEISIDSIYELVKKMIFFFRNGICFK